MSDVYNILGIQGRRALYRPVDWLTRPALLRFCQAFATTDSIMAREGFCAAADWLVRTWFARDIRVRGQEQVPADGPLLVISNHPGAFDSAAIGASLGRDDLRIIASNAPFLRRLPTVSQHLIFIAEDAIGRMSTIREGVRHLAAGGALLVFGTGLIDPDPGFMPGAEQALENWYASAEIFLRKAPETRLVLAVASDVLHPPIARNPLARLHRERWKRQRMAELLQFIRQMLLPQQLWLRPKISFGAPVTLADLEAAAPGRRLLAAVIEGEKALLAAHMRAFYGHPGNPLDTN
jgi:hypothetical protein